MSMFCILCFGRNSQQRRKAHMELGRKSLKLKAKRMKKKYIYNKIGKKKGRKILIAVVIQIVSIMESLWYTPDFVFTALNYWNFHSVSAVGHKHDNKHISLKFIVSMGKQSSRWLFKKRIFYSKRKEKNIQKSNPTNRSELPYIFPSMP